MAKSFDSFGIGATIGFRFWTGLTFLCFAVAIGPQGSEWSRAAEKGAKGSSKSSAAKESAKAKDDDGSADDSDLETDESLTALVLPAGLSPTAKTIDRMKFSQELRGLLTKGMGTDADSQAAAKRHFDASHRAVPDDPRASYGYGVALLSQKKTKEARDEFRKAAQQAKAPYLPALQAVVWVDFQKNDYSKGFAGALDLARKVEDTKDAWPTDHDRQNSAEWLGRLTGFLSGPGQSTEHASDVEKLEADLDKLLTSDRKEAYEHGRKFVASRHQNLKALVARPIAEIVAELKQKKEEAQSESKAADAEVKQLEADVQELRKPKDKQVAELKLERRTANQRMKKASTEVPDAQDAVDMLSTPQAIPQVRNTGGRYARTQITMRAETAAEKKARETQLASAKQKLQQDQAVMDQAKQEMTDLKSQIAEAEAEYKKAAAEKFPLLTAARRKAQELAARARDIEHAAMTPEKLKSRVTALETYVPLDPETEKNRLLATLKPGGRLPPYFPALLDAVGAFRLVERQEAVVDFQAERREGGRKDPAAVVAPRGARVPASGKVAVGALIGDQIVAQRLVPAPPRFATVVIHGQRAVIPVVKILLRSLRQILEQESDRLDRSPIGARDSQNLLAKERLGRHRRFGKFAFLDFVCRQAPELTEATILHIVAVRDQKVDGPFHRCLRNGEPRRFGAFQGHELPAEHAHVTILPLKIPPSAIGVLHVDDILHGPRQRLAKAAIFRHAVGFSEGDRGHAVAIHAGVRVGPSAQEPFGILLRNQPAEGTVDVIRKRIVFVGVTFSEKCQDRQGREPRFRIETRTLPFLAVFFVIEIDLRIGLDSERRFDRFPVTLTMLMVGQPLQAGFDGPFGFFVSAHLDRDFLTRRRRAQAVRCGNLSPAFADRAVDLRANRVGNEPLAANVSGGGTSFGNGVRRAQIAAPRAASRG